MPHCTHHSRVHAVVCQVLIQRMNDAGQKALTDFLISVQLAHRFQCHISQCLRLWTALNAASTDDAWWSACHNFRKTIAACSERFLHETEQELQTLPQTTDAMKSLVEDIASIDVQIHAKAAGIAGKLRDILSACSTVQMHLSRLSSSVVVQKLKSLKSKVSDNVVAYNDWINPFNEAEFKTNIFEKRDQFTACCNGQQELLKAIKKAENFANMSKPLQQQLVTADRHGVRPMITWAPSAASTPSFSKRTWPQPR